ncbi:MULTISPECIES: amino acid ABC transporter permease [unclassified Paenibacillus]|uniref:amino acid ABC transporter permease n=1 Tax=unclassified Paenibacillus TaxID=185978 RepID=UPI0024071366|nr:MULTISPECIES: amino acid ABC transporter permease [unclassified Paenibacillus]MDF9839494.1 polar amino acid transport system permease protein [Paenibacillus sp. PastF-2]MDF9846075.1 polar amino acid transport system permease protein [Paenibacillus sp. PastM-2]MDF9852648.1 polar amino acid transport system permease protein [Paenibacillus sp. PastF-1]MDH6477621.1 polar amino acid transport system permease protein [Paenibacillus sp. PastH-2]MDH6505364.1 polar amino acid transport system permea
MEVLSKNLNFILDGLINTILLSLCCLGIALVLGILAGVLQTAHNKAIALLMRGYAELFRGLPILITLFLVFFLLPEFGINVNSFISAMIALSLWSSANISVAVRGAIQSIPAAQTEASVALGLSSFQTMRYVILPQAVRRMLPSVIGLMSNLIQSTSLSVLIGNQDFLKSVQLVIERVELMEGLSVATQMYTLVLAVYFIICFPLSMLAKRLEGTYR